MPDAAARLAAALADRYHLERELGQGGMATVYLAHDLKHDRKVAIKVLKPELAAVLGGDRFVTEIKTTAALQHPNILPLFDSGSADGFLYYVMPYVEGETLRAKLDRETQLAVDEAVKLTTEVADALDYAHRHGVVHRDIKPENILLHDGRPMVADFGIALAVSAAAGGRMTETGLSLGTPHYMSPEQATADKDITARSDIYSLASVLYEMLTGNPPHVGASAQQIIMKIVTEDAAPVTTHRKSVPPNVTAAVAKALEKLPADRFGSARAFADALHDPHFSTAVAGSAGAGGALGGSRWRTLALAAGGVAVVLLATTLWGWLRPLPPAGVPPETQFYVQGDSSFAVTNNCCGASIAISNDGRRVVFMAQVGDSTMFYRRDLSDATAHPIAGTANGRTPFLSPDGRWLGFVRQSTLVKVDVTNGGPPLTLGPAGAAQVRGASWGDDGYIYFTPDGDGPQPIYRVSADGGDPKVFSRPDTAAEIGRAVPHVLPGSHVLLYATAPRSGGDANAWVVALDMARGTVHRLTPGFQPYYSANGYLTYALANGSIMARRFDPKTFALSGAPIRLADHAVTHNYSEAEYAVANDGTMVIRALGDERTRLQVYSERGQLLRTLPGDVSRHSPRFSPDGRRIAYVQGDYNLAGVDERVWVYDLQSGIDTPLSDTGQAVDPIWSADGRSVRWLDEAQRVARMLSRPADQSGPAAPFGDSTLARVLAGVPADAVQLGSPSHSGGPIPFFLARRDGQSTALWVMDADGTHPRPFLQTAFHTEFPAVSPNGKWVAYQSDETGRNELYVEPFPNGGPRYRVTTSGGEYPAWATDTSLVYEDDNYHAVRIGLRFANGDVRGGPPSVITGAIADQIVASRAVDVSPDGKTLAVITQPGVSRILVTTDFLRHLADAAGRP
jgi:eukaryotic-like serine/threonine-protein kinase